MSVPRFTQHDPTGQEQNPYAYSTGCPTSFNDPAGASSSKCEAAQLAGGIAGGVLGGLIGESVGPEGAIAGVGIGASVQSGWTTGLCNSKARTEGSYLKNGLSGVQDNLVGAAAGVIGGAGYKLLKIGKADSSKILELRQSTMGEIHIKRTEDHVGSLTPTITYGYNSANQLTSLLMSGGTGGSCSGFDVCLAGDVVE